MAAVRAPELSTNLGWLHTDRPLHLAEELRGQVVVLDFWTYCCINCIHILPDLAWLEHKYVSQPVCFIGVHSAKFDNEANRETIRAAIHRYEINHPVIIDENMHLWRQYAVRSWPTVVVIDPRGYVTAVFAGEGQRDNLDQAIQQALETGRQTATLAAAPIIIKKDGAVQPATGLKFPGKVHADAVARRLFIADSNHNRIIIAEYPNENGICRVIKIVGTGDVGRNDGSSEQATFHHPQGMASAFGKLFVADTENHLIREIDLNTYNVRTVVGTGNMVYDHAGGQRGTQQGINSPWDITMEGSTLYVAMAGEHQIWRIDMPIFFARALAGSGRENLVDGPTETSAFAQPSGICLLNGTLYVADSEVSAIRAIDLATERVTTTIGQGLFYFGDEDGTYPDAKLQHPLGVAAWGASLLVADTYNHKIKLVSPNTRSVSSRYGTGLPQAIADNGSPAFFEPGGLCVANDNLFIADTNNHRIVHINLKTNAWRELAFDGLTAPVTAKPTSSQNIINAGTIRVAPQSDTVLTLRASLPDDAHLNASAPWCVRISDGGTTIFQQTGHAAELPITATIPSLVWVDSSEVQIDLHYAYCLGDQSLCVPHQLSWKALVKVDGANATITLKA